MRDRLIKLLQDNSYLDVLNDEHWLLAAEQLLENGVIKELTEENERLRAERDLRDIVIKDLTERNKELQTANEDLGQYCQELERELLEGGTK